MDMISWGVLIIAVAVVVAVVVAVPAILQLRRTLSTAERFMNDMDESLKSLIYDEVKPLVRSINNTMDEVDGIVRTARDGVEKVEEVVDSFSGLADTIRTVNELVDTNIKGSLVDIASYLKGFKVGMGTLIDLIRPNRKREVA